jgi:LysM repeat protein
MTVLRGADPRAGGVHHDDPVDPHYVIPVVVAVLVIAVIVAFVISFTGGGGTRGPTAAQIALTKLPPWWTVHSGESYSVIAHKTGLSVDQIVAFNPYTNPDTIVPGQRLALRMNPPLPRSRTRQGPVFHTVRTGETFDSIARKTHHDTFELVGLNPKLSPASLQPGQRMRLRR